MSTVRRNRKAAADRIDVVATATGHDRDTVLEVFEAVDALGYAELRTDDTPKSAIPDDYLRSARDLLDRPDPGPTPFVVRGLVVEKAIGVVQGRYKVGKTWLVLELILAMIGERPAFGNHEAERAVNVLAVFEESGEQALSRRLRAMLKGYGIKKSSESLSRLHYAANAGVRLMEPEWQEQLIADVLANKIEVVIFDPLARLKGAVEENSQKEMAPLLDFLRRLRDETGATVLFVHHTGHEGNHLRGTSDLEGYWETKLTIEGKPTSGGPFKLVADHREAEKTELGLSYFLVGDRDAGTFCLQAVDARGDRAQAHRDLVLDYIREYPGRGANAIHRDLGGNREALLKSIKSLVGDGLVRIQREGRSKLCFPVEDAIDRVLLSGGSGGDDA